MTRRQLRWARILFGLYLVAVAVLCFARFPESEDGPKSLLGIPMDKIVHFLMFLPFPILAFLAFDQYTDSVKKTLTFVGVTLAVGLLLAGLTEWGQAVLTNYRSGDPLDFLADSIGLLISAGIVTFWDLRKQKR